MGLREPWPRTAPNPPLNYVDFRSQIWRTVGLSYMCFFTFFEPARLLLLHVKASGILRYGFKEKGFTSKRFSWKHKHTFWIELATRITCKRIVVLPVCKTNSNQPIQCRRGKATMIIVFGGEGFIFLLCCVRCSDPYDVKFDRVISLANYGHVLNLVFILRTCKSKKLALQYLTKMCFFLLKRIAVTNHFCEFGVRLTCSLQSLPVVYILLAELESFWRHCLNDQMRAAVTVVCFHCCVEFSDGRVTLPR